MLGQGSGGSSTKCPLLCFDELLRKCLPCNLYQTPVKCSPSCFDELLRKCLPCNLFQTPKTAGADNISSSSETVTLMTQVSSTSSAMSLFRLLPDPYLLLGILIGLALVLAMLYVLLMCLLQRRLQRAPVDAEASPDREPAQGVDLPTHQEPKVLQTQNCNLGEDHDQHPLQECDGAPEPTSTPSHSFPVPATELGAMVLVTTKTTTMEL